MVLEMMCSEHNEIIDESINDIDGGETNDNNHGYEHIKFIIFYIFGLIFFIYL